MKRYLRTVTTVSVDFVRKLGNILMNMHSNVTEDLAIEIVEKKFGRRNTLKVQVKSIELGIAYLNEE